MRRFLLYLSTLFFLFELSGCSLRHYKETDQFNACSDLNTKNEGNLNVSSKGEDVSKYPDISVKIPTEIAINETYIMDTINTLAQSPRPSGTDEERISCTFLDKLLKDYGYNTEIQEFEIYPFDIKSSLNFGKRYERFFDLNPYNLPSVGISRNLIATKTSNKNTTKTLIISAHYDSTKNTIGAFDNASGCGVLLELSRILKPVELPFNIKFIFFGGEECYLAGSRYYVMNLPEKEKSNIISCINIDMVGSKESGDLVMVTHRGFKNLTTHMIDEILSDEALITQYGGTSDHSPFAIEGIPPLTITQGHHVRSKENELEQLANDKLKNTVELLMKIILNYDLEHEKNFLTQTKPIFVEKDSFDIPPNIDVIRLDNAALPGYKLEHITCRLINNGDSSSMVYTFRSEEGTEYYISMTSLPFTKEINLEEFDVQYDKDTELNFYINKDDYSSIKLMLDGYVYQITIGGNITMKEAIAIYKKCIR